LREQAVQQSKVGKRNTGHGGYPFLRATYYLKSEVFSLEEAGRHLAAEQSTGAALPTQGPLAGSEASADSAFSARSSAPAGADVAHRTAPPPLSSEKFPARLISLDEASSTVTIEYDARLLWSVPALVAVLLGEGLELAEFSACRLVDIQFGRGSLGYLGLRGPRFGVPGIRAQLGVESRPLLAAIIKPSWGLDPEEAASLASAYVRGGADIVKDDEVSSLPYSSLASRIRTVAGAVAKEAARRGRPVAYAANITGPAEEWRDRIDLCLGWPCVWPMLCEHAVGLDGARYVAGRAGRPVLFHRAGSGSLLRSRLFGTTQKVTVTLARLLGGDIVHCGSFRGKLFDGETEAASAVEAALGDLASSGAIAAGDGSPGPCEGEGDPQILPSLPLVGGGFGKDEVVATRGFFGTEDICFVLGKSAAFASEGPERAVAAVASALEHRVG
jgi:ribulose-bisphosphate carboxylase large chain